MAFQIVDDVLDLTATEDVLGKPVASDLREGKVTMAVIHALERCTPEERAKIETILRERAFNGVTHGIFWTSCNVTVRWRRRTRGPCATRSRRGKRFVLFPIPRSSAHCSGRLSLWWRAEK